MDKVDVWKHNGEKTRVKKKFNARREVAVRGQLGKKDRSFIQ